MYVATIKHFCPGSWPLTPRADTGLSPSLFILVLKKKEEKKTLPGSSTDENMMSEE